MEVNDDLILNTVKTAKQLEALKKKLHEKKDGMKSDDLQLFRQSCSHEDINTSLMACEMIVEFVKSDTISLTQAMSFFITSLHSTKNNAGLVKGITDLLLMSIRSHTSPEKCVSFDFLQHPFIVLLKADMNNWPIIELQLESMFDSSKLDHVFVVLKPIFVYGLWSPIQTVNSYCRRELWKYLVDNAVIDFEFFFLTLCWLRTAEADAILDVSFFVTNLTKYENLIDEQHLGNTVSLLLADISCNLAMHGYQPEHCLKLTQKLLKKYPAPTDLVLIIFARTFYCCPFRYLHHFVKACADLIMTNGFSDVTVVWMIIAALLPWLSQPLPILRHVCVLSDFFFEIAEKTHQEYRRDNYLGTLSHDKIFMRYIKLNWDSYWAFVIMRKLTSCPHSDIIQRLEKYPLSQDDFNVTHVIRLFLSGIFLSSDDIHVQKSMLNILIKTNASCQLPLILFMLSKASHPDLLMMLTYSLPLTAVNKNNISPILMTLNALTSSKKPILIQVSIQLFLELWKNEKRCYPFLSEQIQKQKVVSPDVDCEKDVIIAQAIREICTLEPVKYGKEWVPILSDIMSRCSETYDCLPLVEALTAILKLCEASVVSVLTVFKELSYQRMFEDKRPKAIEKLCQLVEMIFVEVRETTVDQHWPTINAALETMWNLVNAFRHAQIAIAALRALAKFDVALMTLKVIPHAFQKNLKLSNSSDVSSHYVPGSVWISYLQKVPEAIRMQVCRTISSWLQTEVRNLGRGFQRSIRGEPQDVSFLHDKSIFKAIVKYLKRLVVRNVVCTADELRTVISCLLILNDDSVTQLPLFDWAFLGHFLKYDDNPLLKKLVLQFFSKQSGSSVSARKGIENYLKSIELNSNKIEEIEMILSVIPKACCTVSPPIFANVITPTMLIISEQIRDNKDHLYTIACAQLAKTLAQTDLDEHNRDCVCESILYLWNNVPLENFNNEYLVLLVKTIMQMPQTFVDHLITNEEASEMDSEQLCRFMKFVHLLCMTKDKVENPFPWLNSCINVTFKCSVVNKKLFFLYTKDWLRKHRFHLGKWPWLLQFMDQIYKGMDDGTLTSEKVFFMCDVFIFVTVIFSSYYPFTRDITCIEECREFFPQSLNNIIFKDVFSKVVEWLHFMSKSDRIAKEYSIVFRNAIIALRHNDYLQKVTVWSRIISVF